MFNTIDEVYDYLYNQKKLNKRENLNRIKYAKDALGINIKYKLIHVAGTNGKGSTSAMIKSILMLRNLHIGMFVSPFVISFNERIQINDRYISNAEIMHYANILYDFNEKYKIEHNDVIPFFELTLLMALMYFEDRNIDVAIIECGLGGLLDSTNFIDSNLSIITNVGFDHMTQLGNTLEEICNHKMGIIKNNSKCITAIDKSLMKKVEDYAKSKNSTVLNIVDNVSDINVSDYTYFKYNGNDYKTNLLGEYQAYNASIAIEAVKYMYDIEEELIRFGLSNVFWPGRFEIIRKEPLIIIDGAHNIHAINALVNSLENNYNYKFNVVFSSLIDKDYKSMLKKLDTITNKYIFTSINDLRRTNALVFKECTNIDSIVIDNYTEALDMVINDNKPVLITGSLHFISFVREYLINKLKRG